MNVAWLDKNKSTNGPRMVIAEKKIEYIEEERLRERAQGQMRDVQTERKEALFIIFVARVSFRALTSEREMQKGMGGERMEGAERSLMDMRKPKNEGGKSFLSRIRM